MLSEETRPEPEASEAAAVLAQITAPWVEDNHTVHGLSEQLSSLVQSLTRKSLVSLMTFTNYPSESEILGLYQIKFS
jgi:hypothetical protein